ncbi:MAG TPA: Hsp70 family protein [Polyangiaceae bacterium]|nr:Hsp70 family protein [Polyangiaceae bacterium]
MSGHRVGIDLGTTYSLVAALVDGEPRVLNNALGEALTPSVVYVETDGTLLIGAAAKAKSVSEPGRAAQTFKRDMGLQQRYQLGDKTFSAEELSALVLRQLKEDAEAALGGPVVEAVVTVPAYFGELQRQATRAAAELAGLSVERIINEPTAAALAYGLHERHREFSAVVLDLGGGTFDVTLLEIMEGVIEIQASAGDTRLGGEDFLEAIFQHALGLLRARSCELAEGSVARARLREACEQAKRRLSSEETTRLALPQLETLQGAQDIELTLTRAEVEATFAPLLERMAAPILQALRDANRSAQSVEEVLLVGGATRMPCVARLASQIFGRLPLRALPPDEAVALGAAVQVALKAGDVAVGDIVVTDVAPFSLGLASVSQVGGATVPGLFSPILERGTVLPASRVERFSTVTNGQTMIKLEIFQGEHSLCEKNQKLGEYTIKDLKVAPAGEQSVDVRFSYDMNGVLDVDATVVATGKSVTFTIERAPGRLSKQELEATRQRLQRLKFHPRQALPNVTALARAEALFVELTGPERGALGGSIGQFRAALEAQDQALIVALREALLGQVLTLGQRGR